MDFQAAIDQQLNKPGLRRSTQAEALEGFVREEKNKDGLHPLLLAGPVLAGLADAYSTNDLASAAQRKYQEALALSEANPGQDIIGPEFTEHNKGLAGLVGKPEMYGVKGGIGLGISGLAELAARTGHRNLGKALAITGTIGGLAFAGNNFIQKKKLNEMPRPATPVP